MVAYFPPIASRRAMEPVPDDGEDFGGFLGPGVTAEGLREVLGSLFGDVAGTAGRSGFLGPYGGGYARGARGSLVSQEGSDDLYQPSNEEIAALFGGRKAAGSGPKEAGPGTPAPEYREMSPAEQEMEDRFQAYQRDPESFAATRETAPGELRFALGKGPLQTYKPGEGDQV